MRDPNVGGPSWDLEVQLYWIYGVLLALVCVAWGTRWLLERRRGLINIAYPGGRVVRVPIKSGHRVESALASFVRRQPHAVAPTR
jgi:hypothetical protein